jgi:hypothetical protein
MTVKRMILLPLAVVLFLSLAVGVSARTSATTATLQICRGVTTKQQCVRPYPKDQGTYYVKRGGPPLYVVATLRSERRGTGGFEFFRYVVINGFARDFSEGTSDSYVARPGVSRWMYKRPPLRDKLTHSVELYVTTYRQGKKPIESVYYEVR